MRSCVAIVKALVTSNVFCWVSIDQPTTLRENASRTTQQTLPSLVGCSVMSVIHSRFGAVSVNSRLTRSVAAYLPAFALRQTLLRESVQAETTHQQRHGLAVDEDASPVPQLGRDASLAVDPAGLAMHVGDLTSKP